MTLSRFGMVNNNFVFNVTISKNIVLPDGCCEIAYYQAAVMVMEDSEAFNAGRGSKLTVSGLETFLQL